MIAGKIIGQGFNVLDAVDPAAAVIRASLSERLWVIEAQHLISQNAVSCYNNRKNVRGSARQAAPFAAAC
jgi:hypothetical protein